MTSKNSSSVNTRFIMPQREMTKRRLWVIGLTSLMFILYFIIGMIIVMYSTRMNFNAALEGGYLQKGETLDFRLVTDAVSYLKSGLLYAVTAIAAVASGIQGYSYLHSKKAVDFYESQPVSRRAHFTGVFLNSFFIYLVIYVVTMAIGVLAAFAFGAGDIAVILAALESLAINIGLFLACFSVAALSAILTGNAVVSILAAFVLFLYEPAIRFVLNVLKEQFFKTFPGDIRLVYESEYISPFCHVFHDFGKGAVWHNLVFAAVVMLITYFCYTRRKNESAGSAVVFRPVRIIVKIAVAVLGALAVGWMFVDFSGNKIGLMMAVIAAAVIGFVMEIIYAYNFKALTKHWISTVISVVISVAVLLIFMLDVFGYDSWMPNEEKVESAAVTFGDYYTQYYDAAGEEYSGSNEYAKKYMHITDIGAVQDLVGECREEMEKENGAFMDTIHVSYKMKNGSVKERNYSVPTSIDPEIMQRLLSNKDFKEGFYPIYHSEFMDTFKGKMRLVYSDGVTDTVSAPGYNTDLDAFRNAYLTDIEKLDYYYMFEHRCLGNVITETNEYPYVSCRFPLYEGFGNTLNFLKSEGIDVPDWDKGLKNKDKLTVTYYRVTDDEMYVSDPEELDGAAEGDAREMKPENEVYIAEDGTAMCDYTDKAKVEAIKEALRPELFEIPFAAYLGAGSGGFEVVVPEDLEDGYSYPYVYVFIKDKIPEFVLEDFAEYM